MMSSPEKESSSVSDIARFVGISAKYGQGPEIVSGADMALEKSSFTFLTGPSGAGKSTILSLLSLRLRPSAGHISVFGKNVWSLSSRQRQKIKHNIGVVTQASGLIDHLSVFDNVGLPLRATGISRNAYQDDVIEILRWVGLGEKLEVFPPTLSGGEKQRVAIARAVIAKPAMLLADEPTGNVDPAMGQRLLRLFLEMNRNGTTVLIATHDQGLLSGIRADVLTLENGRLNKGISG